MSAQLPDVAATNAPDGSVEARYPRSSALSSVPARQDLNDAINNFTNLIRGQPVVDRYASARL